MIVGNWVPPVIGRLAREPARLEPAQAVQGVGNAPVTASSRHPSDPKGLTAQLQCDRHGLCASVSVLRSLTEFLYVVCQNKEQCVLFTGTWKGQVGVDLYMTCVRHDLKELKLGRSLGKCPCSGGGSFAGRAGRTLC